MYFNCLFRFFGVLCYVCQCSFIVIGASQMFLDNDDDDDDDRYTRPSKF